MIDKQTGEPTSYTIVIDEPQRVALHGILAALAAEHLVAMPEALEYWVAMLEGLPSDEKAHPGVLHGFCL